MGMGMGMGTGMGLGIGLGMGVGVGMGMGGADTVTAWVDWRVHPRYQRRLERGRGEGYSSCSWVRVARVSCDHKCSGRLAGCGTQIVL